MNRARRFENWTLFGASLATAYVLWLRSGGAL